MFYANGDKYDGDWENELPHGKGIYDFANGDKYSPIKDEQGAPINNFKNGKKEGAGNYFK